MVQRASLNYSFPASALAFAVPHQREAGRIAMHGEEKRFAHVVLFECPWCLRLLSSAFLSFNERVTDHRSEARGDQSTTMCTCGWVGNALEIAPASHSVQPWNQAFTQRSPVGVQPTEEIAEKRDWLFLVAKQIGSFSGQNVQNTP